MRCKIIEMPGYKGPERRIRARRRWAEWRRAIRWEPRKEDRRRLKGRRRSDIFYYTGTNR